MTKHKLAIVSFDHNDIALCKNIKGKDIEIKNFKSLNACSRYLKKNYKRIDAYSINKDYGVYIKNNNGGNNETIHGL
jgi:hypothetical protein